MADDARERGDHEQPPADEAALSARFKRLGERLGHVHPDRPSKTSPGQPPTADPSAIARGFRLSAELVAGGLGGAGAAGPRAARAQQSERMRHVAILPYTERDAEIRTRIATFRQQLRKLGWAEGDNLRTEERWSGDDMDRVRRYVAELVNLN